MKSVWIASVLLGAVGGGAWTHSAPLGPQGRLVRVTPTPSADAQDIEGWRQRLSASDLASREKAFDALVGSALTDRELERALESWCADTTDLGLAWTSRLALRELRARREQERGMRGMRVPGWGIDPFADSQSMVEDLRRQMDEMLQRGAPPLPSGPASSSFESFSLQSGPDGVTCKVTKSVDGRDVTEEYSAATIDELLDAHPELREHVAGQSLDPFSGLGARGLRLQLGAPPSSLPPAAPGVRTDVLGVVVQSLAASEASDLSLDPGVGLRIERVEPGTIAQQLGLQRGQVLLEINGTKIRSRDDISSEIKKRGSDGALEVIVIDRWGQKRTRTWKPDTAKQI